MSFLGAALVKIVVVSLFLLVVACLVWVLSKAVPDGRLKVFLFKVRGEGGLPESRKDKWLARLAVVTIVALFIAFYAWLMVHYAA